MHEPDADGQDDRTDDPYPNLREGQPARFNFRVQTMEDPDEDNATKPSRLRWA